MNKFNYGFQLSEIKIVDNKFIKRGKNREGINKINNEISFYKYIINIGNTKISIPKLIDNSEGKLIIEYIENSKILTNIINKTNIDYYINKIIKNISNIHCHKIYVSYETILKDITFETEDKILNRYYETNWENIPNYNNIKKVNNIIINKNIKYYTNIIKNKLLTLIKKLNINEYNLIHGDIHLGNILLNDKEQIYFIDPRGYFGKTKLYGLKQYDYAKLLFGLSGYSMFDNLEVNDLNIINENITINFIKQYEYIFNKKYFDKITNLFFLSIWLGNNSCFVDNNKKITSLMIAFYYCEIYLK